MNTVRIAFYKPKAGDWFGQAIAWYTRLFNWGSKNYCHVEIGIPDETGYRWYSSASKNTNGTTGTRWIPEKVLFEHIERWDVYQVKAVRTPAEMIQTANAECGKAYDWAGIFGFLEPFSSLNNKNKWYCSEVCNYVFFGKWDKRISPERFYTKIRPLIISS